jgi:hypothetical protein
VTWEKWKASGLVQQVADLVRSEWDRRFPDEQIEGERVEDGRRRGGVLCAPDRTGGGDFIRALINGDGGSQLRATYYPSTGRAYYNERRRG